MTRRLTTGRVTLVAALVVAAGALGACTSPGAAPSAAASVDAMMEHSPSPSIDAMMEHSPSPSIDAMMEHSPAPS